MRSRIPQLFFAFAAAAALLSQPAFAHHSTAMFDMATPFTITGVVKRFEWTNPHAWIYLDVTNRDGGLQEWSIQLMSVNQLESYGWGRGTVRPGQVITCTGGRAKTGMPAMISFYTRLADGRTIRS